MLYNILTPRLKLKRITEADEDKVSLILKDAAMMQYILGKPATDSEVKERMTNWLKYNNAIPHFGIFLIEDISTNELIGYSVARHVNYETNSNELEIGYAFFEPHWGKGLATEVVPYLCHYLFTKSNVDKMHAFTDPENEKSIKVLQKSGFSFIGTRDVYGGSNEYQISREEFYQKNNNIEADSNSFSSI